MRVDNPDLHGEMTTTVVIRKVSMGSALEVVQEGSMEVIPVEACYLG